MNYNFKGICFIKWVTYGKKSSDLGLHKLKLTLQEARHILLLWYVSKSVLKYIKINNIEKQKQKLNSGRMNE